VLLLPFLEEERVYDELRLDQPWDSQHNRDVLGKHVGVAKHFRCPAADEQGDNDPTEATYILFSTDDEGYRLEKQDVPEASILVSEVTQSGIHWAEPRDHPAQKVGPRPGRADDMMINCYHQFANVLLKNGEIRSVPAGQSMFSFPVSKTTSPIRRE